GLGGKVVGGGSQGQTTTVTKQANGDTTVVTNETHSSGSGFAPGTAHIPTMAVVQMQSPVVSSSGASVTEIENYLISLPGFPPDVAAQIRAIGDPSTTLPVPVPTGQQSHQVDVN